MGCEIARQLLDLSGHSHVTVEARRQEEEGVRQDMKPFLLEEPVYHGKSLFAVAQAAHEAVAITRLPDPWMSSNSLSHARGLIETLIVPAWAAFFIGAFLPKYIFWKWLGQIFLGGAFIVGTFDFSSDLEINRETQELLKKTGCFDPDELVKLRYLLDGLRWEGVAKIVKTPLHFFTKFFFRGRHAL